ncbi:MAG: OadG family protein [Bacteroidales bacterium]|nr:OadG family protein [Bacteroidales bacterium]
MNKNIFLKGIFSVFFLGSALNAFSQMTDELANQAAAAEPVAENGDMTGTVIGVLVALIVLYLLFKYVRKGSASASQSKDMAVSTSEPNVEVPAGGVTESADSGEVFAAIGMAMHQFQDESHDVENTVLTILRVARIYSPWSSKIYGLRQTPHR